MRVLVVLGLIAFGLAGCSADSFWCEDRMNDSFCQDWQGPGEDPRMW